MTSFGFAAEKPTEIKNGITTFPSVTADLLHRQLAAVLVEVGASVIGRSCQRLHEIYDMVPELAELRPRPAGQNQAVKARWSLSAAH